MCGSAPSTFRLTIQGKKIYIAGDTALFSDMALYGAGGLDLAILPIGDNFTMGPDDALLALDYLKPKAVIPCHYNTWPYIEVDVAAWLDRVQAETAVLRLHTLGPRTVLAKGLRDGATMVDLFYDGHEMTQLRSPWLPTDNRKGSGDTLSAALAVFLARGIGKKTAVLHAHQFTQTALAHAANWQIGHGAGPLAHWLTAPKEQGMA